MSIPTIMYVFLSMFSVLLGITFFIKKKEVLIFFMFFCMIIPTSNQFMEYISFSGIYFYDYFFLAITVYFLLRISINKQISRDNLFNIILFFLFVVFYSSHALVSSVQLDKYLFRDLRPFLTLFYAIVFIDLIRIYKFTFNIILNLIIFTFLIKICFFLFIIFGISFSDVYYNQNSFRYFDASTFIASIFLIVSFFKKKKMLLSSHVYKLNFAIMLAVIVVFISNLRILLFTILFIYLFINHKRFFFRFIIVLLSAFIFVMYSYFMQVERVTGAFDLNNFVFQLANRFSPAIEKIIEMKPIQYIYGLGFGTYFNIPWFEYRGLDTKLNTVDSTYLSLFVKYGIFSLILLFLFFKVFLINIHDIILKKSLIIFYLFLFFTLSILYQSGAIFHIIFINILMISLKNENPTYTLSVNS